MRGLRGLKLVLAVAVMTAASQSLFATDLNLTTTGATGTTTAAVGGSFTVVQISPQSTGTGVIDPFVRIQRNNDEEGYNTSAGTPMDTKPPEGFTRALQLSEIPIVNLGGVNYRQFLLDINESSGSDNELLKLDQIQIFMSANQAPDGLTSSGAPPALTFPAGTEIFKMSAVGNADLILLDYSLNAGSGSGDMFLYVNSALFVGGPFVTMYSHFGHPPPNDGWDSSDGFEEWAVLKADNPPTVPEPTSLLLVGLGLVGLAADRVRRSRS
jgi:hypothetical protein